MKNTIFQILFMKQKVNLSFGSGSASSLDSSNLF